MKKINLFVFALFCFSSSLLGAGNVEQEIRQLNGQLEQAYLNEDISALEFIPSDDHVHNNVFGMKMNRETFLKDIKDGTLRFERYETPELEIKTLDDGTVLVTGFIEAEAYRNGHPVIDRFLFTRIFIKRNERWQVIHFHNTIVREVAQCS